MIDQLDEFRSRRRKWLEEVGDTAPVYSLPPSALATLGASYSRRKILADRATIEIEREFSALCESNQAVGLWNGGFMHYPCLRSPTGFRQSIYAKLTILSSRVGTPMR